MSACEKCWSDAGRRAYSDTSKTKSEHYMDLLEERKDNPCTPDEQRGGRDIGKKGWRVVRGNR